MTRFSAVPTPQLQALSNRNARTCFGSHGRDTTKHLDHCRGITTVESKRRHARPMRVHPSPETADDAGSRISAIEGLVADADLNQVFVKALRSEVHMVVCFTAFRIWTVAGKQRR